MTILCCCCGRGAQRASGCATASAFATTRRFFGGLFVFVMLVLAPPSCAAIAASPIEVAPMLMHSPLSSWIFGPYCEGMYPSRGAASANKSVHARPHGMH